MRTSKYRIFIYLLLCLTVVAKNGFTFERFDTVSTMEMQELHDKRKNGDVDFILVNALDKIIFREHSIPQSINIPLYDFDNQLFMLGDDREKDIITYCMGHR